MDCSQYMSPVVTLYSMVLHALRPSHPMLFTQNDGTYPRVIIQVLNGHVLFCILSIFTKRLLRILRRRHHDRWCQSDNEGKVFLGHFSFSVSLDNLVMVVSASRWFIHRPTCMCVLTMSNLNTITHYVTTSSGFIPTQISFLPKSHSCPGVLPALASYLFGFHSCPGLNLAKVSSLPISQPCPGLIPA